MKGYPGVPFIGPGEVQGGEGLVEVVRGRCGGFVRTRARRGENVGVKAVGGAESHAHDAEANPHMPTAWRAH